MMLTLQELNQLCADIASETLSELTDQEYIRMMKEKYAQAEMMEYAAQSYDNDAIEYGVKL
jgi:hypothetical protein